ncbi:unnamed protein product [Dicrocoelium dendriticum]|nr:unnamed protein product [Dicrocoelium dendriticum]
MKMTQNGHSPKSLKAPPVASSPFTSFLVGSYVMASWRNQFEYLAEVLAHRHRQGDKSEYRLRYVWDNVVEWTPVSRLRKATQFEIDYVLKFCREHGGEGSGKPLSEVSPKSTDKSVRSSSVSASSPMTSAPPTFSTRSQTKKLSLEPNSCLTKTAHSTNQSGTPSATASSEPKTNPLSLVSDGVQQDGMVYDKAVLQFHEACRRRRELKRQAIEEDKPSTTDSIVSTLGETPVACAPKTNSTNSPPHIPPESKEEVIQSFAPLPKAAKLSPTDDTDSSHHSSPRLPSASELENSVDPHNDIDVRESKINTCRTSANSPKAATSLAPVASPSKNTLKTRASPNVQLESTTKSSSSTQVAKRPAVEWNTLPSTPVIYQCPHCPRKLRHSKLLAAHIANYHKSAQDASKPSPSGPALTRADKQASTTAECTRSTSLTTSIKPESTNSSTSSHQMAHPELTPIPKPHVRVNSTTVVKSKLPSETQDRPTNNEQVNRFYMELRASMTDPDSEHHPSRLSLTKELPDEPPTTDSEIPSICWSLCEESVGVDASTVDANISNQVLSGFLQDLGPNVISDLVDLGSDAIAGDVEGPEVDCFLRRHGPDTSVSQPSGCPQDTTPCTSVPDTPTKGLGPLLSSPGGVATLLQAAISNTLPISNRLDFIPPHFGVDTIANIPDDHADTKNVHAVAPTTVSTPSCSLAVDQPNDCPPPTEYPVSNPIASIPSIPTTSSGHSLLDAAATTSMYPDATMVVSNSPCLHASSEATVAGARVTAVSEHLSTNTSTCLGSTDADWLSGGIPNAKSPRLFMLPPFTSTDTSSHVPGRSLPSNSSVLEDALGSVNPFSLDMVSDTLTPDEVSVVNANLNQLDQFVLLPLERALTVMESHLDFITKQVDVLEQDQERSGTLARMSTEHSELTEDTALEPDSFLLSSSSNSPFGSSSSFSLSPYGMRPDEVPVSSELPSSTNPLDPPSSQLVCDSTSSRSHAAKQAARQLYRLTMFRRFQREAHLKSRSIRHDVPPHKGLNFSRQSPTSARLLNDRL